MTAAQSTLDLRPPDLATARAVGHVAGQLATDKAERECSDFSSRAEAAILAKLSQGRASGEDLTDYVRECGVKFADGRALGSVFARLNRQGRIRCVGFCLRKRGNGTAGGRLWELVGGAA